MVYERIPPGISLEIAAGTFDDVLLPGEKGCFMQQFRNNAQRDSGISELGDAIQEAPRYGV